ncbi:MAG TPA: alcohol dehydrogenase catalytic domain-containing protein, partial [Polyangiaceae bacterium]|nr:alcohol dehydrogenase catalytic domain-containing protein [Polyangiaceae bacterium]
MKALTFHFSYPRFVAGKLFGGLSRGGPLVYEDVPDAKLLGDDWVIVETRYCGICGSDVKQAYLEGAFDNPMTAVVSFPHVLGHEVVGTVVEAGKDVRHVKKGDRVACYPWITCAVRGLPPCAACAAGDLALCQNFAGGRFSAGIHHGTCRDLSGGFATHMPAHESACFAIPSDVTFEEAALADPFSVCLHAVHKAPPRQGETVIVVGCGALGMLLIHLVSRLYPGVAIWGVDVHASRREKALAIGATDFFSLPPRELIATIGERTETPLLRP